MLLRVGFRDFSAKNGQFLLNGKPVFVKGNSINPPGRGLPDAAGSHAFATDYLRYMKEQAHFNAVRIGDGCSSSNAHWYDVADEIGMLIYAGPYGNPQCSGCRAKPATQPPPPTAAADAFANYMTR